MRTYLKTFGVAEARKLAVKLGTSYAYLSQIAYGHRRAGAVFAVRLEQATNGILRREDLRPDLFERESRQEDFNGQGRP
ncbi:transcriptional regulator [Leptospirillum sp. Group II 'CF-1']|uniref:transcriptional regulator n=1 Tax=Leptospirillum sp. Group II 'CF-1' TaxID=1660083 RepID=UPI00067287ED|nr:YdaS family helix-turn-helix protein [Leptospirillum sp. Group II 'CF-1']